MRVRVWVTEQGVEVRQPGRHRVFFLPLEEAVTAVALAAQRREIRMRLGNGG